MDNVHIKGYSEAFKKTVVKEYETRESVTRLKLWVLPLLTGPWLVLAAAVLWGTTGTSQALAPEGATPASIGAVRLVVGALGLVVFAFIRGTLPLRFWRAEDGRWLIRGWTLLGAVAVAAYQVFFFAGVANTGVAVGTVVGIGSAPIMAGGLDWAVSGQRPGRRWFAATLLAISGCVLLLAAGRVIEVDTTGIIFSLVAGFSYAVYTLASKRLLESQEADYVMASLFGLGALLLAPVLFFSELSWLFEPKGTAVALHLGIITVAVAYTLFARGLRIISASSAVSLTLAEPLTAATLGIIVLGERLTPYTVLGILLLLAALVILATAGKGDRGRPRPH